MNLIVYWSVLEFVVQLFQFFSVCSNGWPGFSVTSDIGPLFMLTTETLKEKAPDSAGADLTFTALHGDVPPSDSCNVCLCVYTPSRVQVFAAPKLGSCLSANFNYLFLIMKE